MLAQGTLSSFVKQRRWQWHVDNPATCETAMVSAGCGEGERLVCSAREGMGGQWQVLLRRARFNEGFLLLYNRCACMDVANHGCYLSDSGRVVNGQL